MKEKDIVIHFGEISGYQLVRINWFSKGIDCLFNCTDEKYYAGCSYLNKESYNILPISELQEITKINILKLSPKEQKIAMDYLVSVKGNNLKQQALF